MKPILKLALAGLAMSFILNSGQALAQAEKFDSTMLGTSRQFLELPVIEPVGPLTRMTVHVLWSVEASEPGLSGLQEIVGVWMIDPRDGSVVGHGKWTMALTMGGEAEGTWTEDSSGTMHAVGFITGGDLDGAILNIVSVAGHPLVGWVKYEVRVLLPGGE